MAKPHTLLDKQSQSQIVWGDVMRLAPNLAEERLQWHQGLGLVAGVDEVGRGPLAGPVVAAAVILSPGLTFAGCSMSATVRS